MNTPIYVIIVLMKTSVASLFSLISASFSRRKMRLVAEPTFVKIYED